MLTIICRTTGQRSIDESKHSECEPQGSSPDMRAPLPMDGGVGSSMRGHIYAVQTIYGDQITTDHGAYGSCNEGESMPFSVAEYVKVFCRRSQRINQNESEGMYLTTNHDSNFA